ncbi:alpha/beta fold hydrolase [Chondromyces apiculatus]|uniref:Uncharacterized protein n=1 Tax=Chondromyces apiculatus DSM 436 TaxID=1192034 RepID=A0A017T2M3_9BACT|nr:hypothetical protein [Chondromyces apiculatus]EYF03247.1 Hypothetical protein CAP_5751 [Chondromyces apiculatus DSM 436]
MLRLQEREVDAPEVPVNVSQFVTFYESIQDWPEAEAVRRIGCPRMAYVGEKDEMAYPGGVDLKIAPTLRARRAELERMGWEVAEIEGRDHGVFTDPGVAVPVIRGFLDRVT